MRVAHAAFIAATAFIVSLLGVTSHGSARESVEEVSWKLTVSAGSDEAYRRFLQLHPTSTHAGEAFRLKLALANMKEKDKERKTKKEKEKQMY